MSWNASASSDEQDWTQVRARRQDRHVKSSALRRKSECICNRCAAACFMSYQTCRKCHAVRDGTEQIVLRLDMTTDNGQPTGQAKGISGVEGSTSEETVTAGAGTYRAAKREERQITSGSNRQSGTRGRQACRADSRSPPDRSPNRCCEERDGASGRGMSWNARGHAATSATRRGPRTDTK